MDKLPKTAIDSIMEISPYIQGASKIQNVKDVIKLSSNENPFGSSPKVLKAIEAAIEEIHRYPDGSCTSLRNAIAAAHNINARQIVCGAGSDELIALLSQAYAGVNDEVIYTKYGFLMYPISALRVGAVPIIAQEDDLRVDVDNILTSVTDNTKMIFIANPNNPTGSYLTRDEIIRLADSLPKNIILVIDAAYAEYVTNDDYSSGLDLVDKYPNLVMLRTFSKIYGLGGLRLGWAYASPAITDILNRVRGPFNVSNIAIAAGIAAVEDAQYLAQSVRHNQKWRDIIFKKISDLGLQAYPSQANFILVRFKNPQLAQDVNVYLKSQGIIGRMLTSYHLPDAMRFTIGKEDENLALIKALTEFIQNLHKTYK